MMYFFIIYTDSELLHYNGFPQQTPKADSENENACVGAACTNTINRIRPISTW